MAKYITFRLDDERFGVDVLNVQEIILPGEMRAAPFPNAPSFVIGVINLRGMIVPLIDLRQKLGLDRRQTDDLSRIIIIKTPGKNMAGALVDELSDVADIPVDQIEPMRSETTVAPIQHIRGVYREARSLVVLVSVVDIIFDQKEDESQVVV